MEKHIVYAVDEAGIKHRVSHPLTWNRAIARWDVLDRRKRQLHKLYASYPDRSYSSSVRYFAVRSADDPQWPADERVGKVIRLADKAHSVLIRKPTGYRGPNHRWACAIATDEDSLVVYSLNPVAANAEAHRLARERGLI